MQSRRTIVGVGNGVGLLLGRALPQFVVMNSGGVGIVVGGGGSGGVGDGVDSNVVESVGKLQLL